jgi:hypothetical protein
MEGRQMVMVLAPAKKVVAPKKAEKSTEKVADKTE